MSWTPVMRHRLVDVLTAAGPDGPTLCEGWRTRHLAAHLVLRASDPGYGASVVLPPLAARGEARLQDLAGGATDRARYADLVARVAAGPPSWSPLAWAGDAADLMELVVHTLDVTCAVDPRLPSPIDPELAGAVWARLTRFTTPLLRRVPVGLVLVRDDGPRARVHRPGRGAGTVVVRGGLDDLTLYCFGRRDAARVSLEGAPDDLTALARAQIRI